MKLKDYEKIAKERKDDLDFRYVEDPQPNSLMMKEIKSKSTVTNSLSPFSSCTI